MKKARVKFWIGPESIVRFHVRAASESTNGLPYLREALQLPAADIRTFL